MRGHAKPRYTQPPSNPFSEGCFVVVDKPLKWTSFDVVKRLRYLLTRRLKVRKMKVGHAGTLDPLATGVVVLCTGKYTKRIEETQALSKTYVATLELGATTPSYDLESEIDETYPTEHITCELVEEVLETFVGEIDQVPPVFSAIKVDGVRSYSLAREGQDVELQPRKVVIEEIKLLEYDPPKLVIEVKCGKGTYIRSLARDIGRALDSGAHLTALRRTAIGHFAEEEALNVEDLEEYIDQVLEKHSIDKEHE